MIASPLTRLALASVGEIEGHDDGSSLLSILMMCFAKYSLISR